MEQEKEDLSRNKRERMLSFKDKLVEEFNLKEIQDSKHHDEILMKLDHNMIIKLMPRDGCHYGVLRRVPDENNRIPSFRVSSDEDEKLHYEYVKSIVEKIKA